MDGTLSEFVGLGGIPWIAVATIETNLEDDIKLRAKCSRYFLFKERKKP